MKITRAVLIAATTVASLLALTACGSKAEVAIAVQEPVVRAIDSISPKDPNTGKYMTGAFMTLVNSTGSDVTLTGGTSPIAGIVEIHQVVNGEMTQMPDGLVIPAHGSVALRMGGYHVMLMQLAREVTAGDEVPFDLKFSDGSTVSVTAPVKTIAMDDEVYGVEMAK